MQSPRSRRILAILRRALVTDAVIVAVALLLGARYDWELHRTGDALQLLGVVMVMVWVTLISGHGIVFGRRVEPIRRRPSGDVAASPSADPKRRRALAYPSVLASAILPILLGTIFQAVG